jgi:hypothetical protein
MSEEHARASWIVLGALLIAELASCQLSPMVTGAGGSRATSPSVASSNASTGGGADAGAEADAADAGNSDASDAEAGPVCVGSAQWMTRWGNAADQIGQAVAAGPAGDVALAGVFQGSIDLGGGPLTTSASWGIYVAELRADRGHVWSRAYPGGIDDVSGAGRPIATVAIAPSGDVVLGGSFSGTTDLGAGPVTSQSPAGDGFVLALDPEGEPKWSAIYSDASSPDPAARNIESLAVDAEGNVVALGYTSALPLGALFIVKLDALGNQVWQKDVSSRGARDSTVRVDESGNVIVAGTTYAAVDFGNGPVMASPAAPSLFVAKLDADGHPLWTTSSLATELRLQPDEALALDANGDVYLAAGGGDMSLDVGCGTFPLAWSTRVMSLDGETGACRWIAGFEDFGGSIAALADGTIVVATSGGERLVSFASSGPSASACAHPYTQNVSAEVHGLAALPDGSLLMTGAFALTANFEDEGSALLTSAGQRDVFLAKF